MQKTCAHWQLIEKFFFVKERQSHKDSLILSDMFLEIWRQILRRDVKSPFRVSEKLFLGKDSCPENAKL